MAGVYVLRYNQFAFNIMEIEIIQWKLESVTTYGSKQ